jgi:single-strand DNA-binding protein
MSASINKVIIIGNLGKDPSVYMQDDKKIVNLSVATTEVWKDKGTNAKKERTEWHKVTIFNNHLADIAIKYLKKGSKVYIEGQLQTRNWTDKDGTERSVVEIVLLKYKGELTILNKNDSHVGGEDFRYSDEF